MRTIFIFLLMTSLAYASPTASDDVRADKLFYSQENQQPEYKSKHGKYQQSTRITPRGGKMSIQTDEYVSPLGSGYIVTVSKVLKNKFWIKQKHVGPEDRVIATEWTQVNKRSQR